jgi:2-(1,2-epoxy-1,2-dihydrophenyl)acetyl-CoA isomerase
LFQEANVPDSSGVLYSVANRVATITLDRPEVRNAISHSVAAEIVHLLRQADKDQNVKCIVIQGTGKNFSAGGDVKGFNETLELSPQERYDHFERAMLMGNRLPNALLETSKPIIAATRGAVAGAGIALCLAADFVIAAESTYFLVAHVHIGLCIDCGLSSLLVAAAGIKAAKRLALLGERVLAEEALSLGFVTKIVTDEALDTEVEQMVARLAKGPATAMAASKALLNQAAFQGFGELLAAEATSIAKCAATDDFQRGVRGMLSRTAPEFE